MLLTNWPLVCPFGVTFTLRRCGDDAGLFLRWAQTVALRLQLSADRSDGYRRHSAFATFSGNAAGICGLSE